MLPLTNEQMLEVLVALRDDESPEVSAAAAATIDTLDPSSFAALAGDPESVPEVLAFLCAWPRSPREVIEAAVFNRATPDAALAFIAARSQDPAIIEAISLKQQSLIRSPEIIEAILSNPGRTPEAERRAREVRAEFFEKQFGAEMVAGEQRVRAEAEAIARSQQEAARHTVSISGIEDLIRLGLIEGGVDDSVVAEYEEEFGPFDTAPAPPDQRIDIEQMVMEAGAEQVELSPERVPIFQQVALMSIKDRVMLAIKGTREARTILVRDANRIVASAVLRNPRLTDTEVESISAIKTVPEDVLRQIGQNRAWTRSYTVIHNLVRNPRTPIAISLGFLNRIQTRDMRALSLNKNIPDVIRTTAARTYIKRSTS
ncbi:MAG TPA: hypothetical protein VE262_21225 [Blastocatellia bacterium]|nr:hypothetical protein [Blastocatellia bacterium]